MNDPPDIAVAILDEQTVPVDLDRIRDVAVRTAQGEGATGEISIVVVDSNRMAELHEQAMGERGPTDVLSFPIDGLVGNTPPGSPQPMIGEVIVCPEVAAAQATEGLDTEIDLLIAHGVLHLLGYDHENEPQAEKMREREESAVGRSGARAS